jgi:RNA polymerase sigma-70 factor, ECF subfamily
MSNAEPDQARKQELAELLTACHSQLFGYIHSLVRNLDDADDLFQQTSLVLWRQFDQYDRSRSFLAWACGVARFEVSNFVRSRSRKRLYFSDELNLLLIDAHAEIPSDELDGHREALAGCVQKLRPRDKELLEECYSETSNINEIAEKSGRIPQSVHNSLRRIRRALYECVHRTLAQQDQREVSA